MYSCQNESCALALSKAIFPTAMNCPVCHTLLVSLEKTLSSEDELLIQSLPYVIAYPLKQTLLEQHAWTRINLFKDTFLNYLKYLGLLTASEFFNSPFKERKIVDLFQQNLAQPSFGNWNAFIRGCMEYLKGQKHQFFCSELVAYYETVETGKKRKLYTGEIEFVDNYGEIQLKKQEATAIGMLINFRNLYLGHGLTLDSATSEKLWKEYFPIFRTLLEQLTFCEQFTMLKQESSKYYSLQGVEIKPFETNLKIDSNVCIYNNTSHTYLPVIPFFIIPGEVAIEKEEIANILSYESYTGKTIKFFSPEGIEKQTSGKILERLNLLLRDKQKEIPFTPDTFTKNVFLNRIAEENELILKTLLSEKKVIEGIYQHREEIEIKLREWIGARANVFFIAAEAGSGKTNLLVEIQKQYAERSLSSLFIRAARMEKPSLKEELSYLLNIDASLEISNYTALAGTQAEPTFILIDSLNESSNAESIWQEILKISDAFESGSLKFIITNRANSKSDLGRYATTKKNQQYLYGDNNDNEKGLEGYAFWLTPLDMKEMEGAWNGYRAKDKNQFKPLFSFNDIATFDRGLYLQLNNPLVLRIFMETYKGKNLPKKGVKYLQIWKDWLASFNYEEQIFMQLLADIIWEKGENKLLLDAVLHHEKLQSYFLTDNIRAPYLRLLRMGWISRYSEEFNLYVSFTVEGVLFYLLGTKLNQQNPGLTTEAIGNILTEGTKLQKTAIESFLCEQALEGKIDLIIQLIDEGGEMLELCVTPLLYFLKSQGVEKTIEKLLENPTENDWMIFNLLCYQLDVLDMHLLKASFLNHVMPLNKMNSKESIILGLNAIEIIDNINADQYLTQVQEKASFIDNDALILNLLGVCQDRFGNYEKAFEFYEKSLELYLKNKGSDNSIIATIYLSIGRIWDLKADYDKALEYYSNSLVIDLKTFGQGHSDLAVTYNYIGHAWQMKNEFNKALEFYEKALLLYVETLGSEHSSVAVSYNNLGGFYLNKDYDKALEYYQKSLIIFIKSLGIEHEYLTATYFGIGLVYEKKMEYDKALSYFYNCLKIQIKKLGSEHPDVATTYMGIGNVWKNKGNCEKAIEYYEKSLFLYFKTLGSEHPNVAILHNNIGLSWGVKYEYNKALNHFHKSLDILIKTKDEQQLEEIYFSIGDSYKNIDQFENAIKYLLMAFTVQKQGGYAFRLAKCYEALNERENALNYYIQSAEIRKDNIGIDDEITQDSIANVQRIANELYKENDLPEWLKLKK